MKLTVSRSKNSTLYYVQKSFRTDDGRSSTKTVERLGRLEELIARFGAEDPVGAAKVYVRELSRRDREQRREVMVRLSQDTMIRKEERRCFNGGYLFLQRIYHELGLDRVCKRIERRHKNGFDLDGILSMLLYTRILYPGSKLSSLEDAKKFIEQPGMDIHQVYRALSLLSEESDFIQAEVYRYGKGLHKRDGKVIYYDCTNYYFESEEESGLRQYGHSKEHRPNPIVQMGLFMDMEGFPLAFCINPGNTAETGTLKPLEDRLRDDFGLSRVVVCTDCGLSSYENRRNDAAGERAFITVQSLKKLKREVQGWALGTEGWRRVGADGTYDISEVAPEKCGDALFYKERWLTEQEAGGLSQRLIVTFSFKYREYLTRVRDRQVERAEKIVKDGRAGKARRGPDDARRFIRQECCTADGELAQVTSYSINREMIEQEKRFDGFYAIATDLEDAAPAIIRANAGRWIIEDGFRIMKSEFEARPVFLRRDDRIRAHFLTCFLALLIYKHLEKKVNRGGRRFSPGEIIGTLAEMDFLSVAGEGYIPTYTKTDLTNNLHGSAGFRTDTQIVSKQRMKKIISDTKKATIKE